MQKTRVLVVGGYGFFGRRLVERLSKQAGLDITVAGRSREAGESLVRTLQASSSSGLHSETMDAMSSAFVNSLRRLSPTVVVNASGPFQGQDYRVAEACIAVGSHYIDLADGREFVTGVGSLNKAAETAGVLVASGASSVPALSSAVTDHLVRGLCSVHSIEIGISPGNRTERGLSTVRGILSYCGQALPTSSPNATIGWLGSHRHSYSSPVGSRLLSPCDVPDLVLLPSRYPGQPEVRFAAGLELEALHRGMNLMAWMAHHRLVNDWSEYAQWLKRAADLFKTWGTDTGAMHVSVQGIADDGHLIRRSWELLAMRGDGPYVPTLAASALIRNISNRSLQTLGATPCLGLLSLEDFTVEMQGLDIVTSESAE